MVGFWPNQRYFNIRIHITLLLEYPLYRYSLFAFPFYLNLSVNTNTQSMHFTEVKNGSRICYVYFHKFLKIVYCLLENQRSLFELCVVLKRLHFFGGLLISAACRYFHLLVYYLCTNVRKYVEFNVIGA